MKHPSQSKRETNVVIYQYTVFTNVVESLSHRIFNNRHWFFLQDSATKELYTIIVYSIYIYIYIQNNPLYIYISISINRLANAKGRKFLLFVVKSSGYSRYAMLFYLDVCGTRCTLKLNTVNSKFDNWLEKKFINSLIGFI